MTDDDRYFVRQREFWKNCLRLKVNRVACRKCDERDPRCFLGDQSSEKRIEDLLIGLCERCKRRGQAPNDLTSIENQRRLLRARGISNTRCYCGEDNPFCFEADHLDGRKHGKLVFGFCINCHLKRTSRQLTEYHPDDFHPRAEVVVVRQRVRGAIEYLELIAESLRPVEEFLQNKAIEESDSRQE